LIFTLQHNRIYDDFGTIKVSAHPGFPINIISFQQNVKDDFVDCNWSLIMGEVNLVGSANCTLTNIYSTRAFEMQNETFFHLVVN